MCTGLRDHDFPGISVILLAAAFEVYHAIKLGFRDEIESARMTTDYRKTMVRASKVARNFAKEYHKLIDEQTADFQCHTARSICSDPAIDPYRPMCEPICDGLPVSMHHPNCSLYSICGFDVLDKCTACR